MKGIFFYDGPFRKDREGNYFGIALNNIMFERYDDLCSELEIYIRIKQIEDENRSRYSRIDDEKYKIYSAPNLSSIIGFITKRNAVKNEISKIIKDKDIIIVRLPSVIGLIAFSEAKKSKKKVLAELVGDPFWANWSHSIKGKIVAPIMWLLTKKAMLKTDFAYYVTNEHLQKLYPTNALSIGCSNVVLEDLNEDVLTKRLDKIRNQSNVLSIGTIGSVDHKIKGQDLVIKAISRLDVKNSSYKYYLVGSGDISNLMNKAINCGVENEVFFMGNIPHKNINDWLDKIDVYIQPSLQEGLPRSLIEAMSRGCLAIGTNVGGIPELLQKEYIINRRSPKELASRIANISEKEFIEQARRNFHWVKKYEKTKLEAIRKSFYAEIKKLIQNSNENNN